MKKMEENGPIFVLRVFVGLEGIIEGSVWFCLSQYFSLEMNTKLSKTLKLRQEHFLQQKKPTK